VAAFSTENILDASDNSFGRMLIDRNGTKWMATNRDVVGFNESNNTSKKMTIGTDTEIYRLQMLEL
jgi:hypothetical protein